MPRFFLNSEDGDRFRDKAGTGRPDAAAARCEAVKILGALTLREPGLVLAAERFTLVGQAEAHLTLFVWEMAGIDCARRGGMSPGEAVP